MGKHYTDRERLDAVKKYRASGMSAGEFARKEGYNRSALKDWVSAYQNLQGDFIRIDNIDDQPGTLIDQENVKMNVLKEDEVTKTSNRFSRFDHSVVVIETKQMKITTSLEQALRILELIYDRL
jgi:transposase-like protein